MAPIISGYTPRINTSESNQSVDFGKWLYSPHTRSVRAAAASQDMDNRDRPSFTHLVKKASETEMTKKVELRPPVRINIADIIDLQSNQ